MIIPDWIFELVIYISLLAVTGGAVYLLVVLSKEWRRGELW